MTDSASKITLVIASPAGNQSSHLAETHSLPADVVVNHAIDIDAGVIRDNIDKCLAQLNDVFANLKQPSIAGWSVGSIMVGLTVTAQGSIGIATAGIEASLEITFNPNP